MQQDTSYASLDSAYTTLLPPPARAARAAPVEDVVENAPGGGTPLAMLGLTKPVVAEPVQVARSAPVDVWLHGRYVMKVLAVALTIALGMSIFWVVEQTVNEAYVRECYCATRKLFGRMCVPLALLVVLWLAKHVQVRS
jgi:hypothetical protein